MLPIIQSLWIGSELSVLEQLALSSFPANGHPFHLYIYDDLKGTPESVIVKDANEIIPKNKIYTRRGSYAIFADWFRWKLLEKKGGYWVDMDVICLKPFDFEDEVLYGCEIYNTPSIGVLRFPPHHPVLKEMVDYCENPNRFRPWDTTKQKFEKTIRKYLLFNNKSLIRWGESSGPVAFKKVLEHNKLAKIGKPHTFFYPVHYFDVMHLFDETYKNDETFFTDTHAVHYWNEIIRRYWKDFDKNATYPENSLIEKLKRKYLY